MIQQFLKPDSTSEAMKLMRLHSNNATWFAGGSKLNAMPTKTDKTIAISLASLATHSIESRSTGLHIGAMCRVQTLIEHELVPSALQFAAKFIYSKHMRNQATLGGEIAAFQAESLLLPTLIAMNAKLILAESGEILVEDYIASEQRELIMEVVIPDPNLTCLSYNITRSAAGLSIVHAAVSLSSKGEQIIVLDGVSPFKHGIPTPIRLRDLENQDLEGDALEQAVRSMIMPESDIKGSAEYKRYIASIVISDLLTECKRIQKEC